MKKMSMFICACLLAAGISSCGEGGGGSSIYHTVIFDSKGGSAVPAQSVAHGEKISKPDDPVKKGYTFDNWTYKGEAWSFIGHVVTEDMTLDANWSIITYSISYNLDGGTNNPSNPSVYTVEDEYNLQDPSKDGFTFVGWTLSNRAITKIEKGTTGDLVIKANWSIITYSITYNLDGGTNDPSNPLSYNIKSPTIELMQPSKLGYTFLGWTTNGTPISSIENGSTGNFNLDANWEAISYSITYNLNGGTNNPSNPLTYTIEDEFVLYHPNRTGHTFSGWLINGEHVSTIKKGTIGDLVIDADWSINHYTAVVKSSDQLKGTVTGGGRYEYNSLITVTATTQEDCMFIGWFSDDSFGKLISQDPSYSFYISDNDIVLFAYFITIEESFFEFELTNQNSYTLTKYNSNLNPKIIIPSMVNNLPVTSIGEKAFENCDSIITIIIPNCVTSIEQYVFRNCSKLVSVSLGSGITSIGLEPFEGCYKLVEVINKSSLNIGYLAYYAKQVIPDESFSKLLFDDEGFILYLDGDEACLVEYIGNKTSITIPDSVTSIGQYAFYQYSFLTSITIPDSVTSIADDAFFQCSKLASVSIGRGITSIGVFAFFDCCKLVEVINKSSLNIIAGEKSYGYVAYYAKQVIPDENSSKLLFDDEDFILYLDGDEACLVEYIGNETSITIPDGVTSIAEDAFSGCSFLTSVIVPESVTTIGKSAFSGCSFLTSISLPFIGESQTSNQFLGYLFGANNSLDNSELVPSSLKSIFVSGNGYFSIGNYAFSGCSSLTSVILNGVTSIGDYAFQKCTSLTSIIIHDGVLSIGQHAFSYCTSLTSITIPDGATSIGQNAFSNCTSLKSITIPDSVTSIELYAFRDCYSLTSAALPNSLASIKEGTFSGCSSLTSVVIPDSVTSIGQNAFSGCYSLKSITIPDSVNSIGTYAFRNCTSLISITIPDSVTSIGTKAFEGCYKLVEVINKTSVNIIAGETSCGYVAYYAKQVITDESFSKLSLDDNGFILYSNGNEVFLFGYVGSKTSIVIPDSVTSIGQYAFYRCSSLTSITIPDSVTSIGEYAFSYCTSLTSSIVIPQGVTSIKAFTFLSCTSLTSVVIPDSVTSIGQYAFSGCHSLNSITISDSIASIGTSAFVNCRSLTSITIPDSVKLIGEYAFTGCLRLVEVINKSSLNIKAGGTSYGYVAYHAKQVITDESFSKLSLDDNGFILYLDGDEVCLVGYVGSKTSIVIPDSVTSIGQYAFYQCSTLTSITIPDSVTSIGQYAFNQCSSLTSVTIPDSVTSIGENAFKSTKLSLVYYHGTQYQWENNISIQTGNYDLKADSIFYYSESEPIEPGNYWHYVDGVPAKW